LEKITDIETVVNLLKQGEIVVVLRPRRTYFGLNGERIRIKNDVMRSSIDLDDFRELYRSAEFVRYTKKDEAEPDKAKDEEYYRWRHK
jgi:hypothetical protein